MVRNTIALKKNNVTKSFVFEEYTQRHVLHTVKYLKKSSGEYNVLYKKYSYIYI